MAKAVPAKKKKAPFFSGKHVRQAIPFIDAGLAALSGVKKVGHYATALRVVTAGASLIPESAPAPMPSPLLQRIKKLRQQIRKWEALQDNPQHQAYLALLRTQMDANIDLLIEDV